MLLKLHKGGGGEGRDAIQCTLSTEHNRPWNFHGYSLVYINFECECLVELYHRRGWIDAKQHELFMLPTLSVAIVCMRSTP